VEFASYDEAHQFICSMTNYEVQDRFAPADLIFRLERVRDFLGRLGDPQEGWRSVHIGGTKGKGSTAHMVDSILRRQGVVTGLFTSPHVVDMRERIQREGKWIGEEDFARLVGAMGDAVQTMNEEDAGSKPTYFEMMTAVAFMYFAEFPVDVGVVEVGLGGRLDATNVLQPIASAITNVGLDHEDTLGYTIAEIAKEKAGILKAGVPAVTGCTGKAYTVVQRTAAERGAPLEALGREIRFERKASGDAVTEAFDLVTLERSYEDLRVSLPGAHQVANAALAVRLVELLRRDGIEAGEDAIREGLASVACYARVQVIDGRPTIIIDGAHNPDSAEALARTIEENFIGRRVILVVGISRDKDVYGFLRVLLPLASAFIATRSDSPRAAAPEELLRVAESLVTTDCVECPDAAAAVEAAFDRAKPNDLIVFTGSFYLAGEVGALLAERLGK